MEPQGVHHVAIKALDIRRTAEFYIEVLGLTETHRNVDEQGLRSIWLRCGSVVMMIERSGVAETNGDGPAPFEHDPPGIHLVAFTIGAAERPAWVARIESLGHRIVHQSDFTIYVQDPDGNRIGLSTWPHPSRPG